MGPVELWDDEIEALRPKLREEADALIASWATPDDSHLPVAERVALRRKSHEEQQLVSEMGVDREITGPGGPIRLRTFVPDQIDAAYLHIHGGGFIAGAPEMLDVLHEIYSKQLNLAIVSVDYRLAPEHPSPAAQDDCEAAAVWLLENGPSEYGTDRVLLGGESAGAHLSACTLLRMRDKHDAIDHFLGANLVFGPFDLGRTPSTRRAGGPDVLTPEVIDFFNECFAPGMTTDQRRDPDISPLYADLRGLVPALFSVGTHDHLLDDTMFMAARWQLADNPMELIVYPESPHACIAMPSVGGHFFPRLTDFLQRCLKS